MAGGRKRSGSAAQPAAVDHRKGAARPAAMDHRKGAAPHYYRVYVNLRVWVRDGMYGPGAQIPTESELCRHFGVSRITVRKAIDELVKEGWVVRYRGRGTFVDPSAIRRPASVDLREIMNQVADIAAATQVRDVSVAEVMPDEETQAALQLEVGASVQKASHVRVMRGVPLGHITTYVPLAIARAVNPDGTSEIPMFELLDRYGPGIGQAEQWISATLATLEYANALEVEVGAPLLKLKRHVYDKGGMPVERVVALYRADSYHYRMHIAASPSAPASRARRKRP